MFNGFSLLRSGCFLLAFAALFGTAQAQTNCANTSSLSDGYSVTLSSVTANSNSTYTVTLIVQNNGCAGCKKLNSFLVQAAPGTYSNVSVQLLSGAFTYANIAMGPNLSGTSLTGFRINNTNGMGNGLAAAFSVTYTLTSLQNQQVQLKTSSNTLSNTFTVADFQSVLSCLNPPVQVIFPYFNPYANKLYDIIGVELTSLYYTYLNNGSYISDDIFQILGSSVRVSIRTQPGQHANAVSALTAPAYGLVQELNDPANNLINGTAPILNLLSLNQLPTLLVSARPIYAPLSNAGLITSQGDSALRSFRARDVFDVDGSGIKIGVLSDSYNTKIGDPASDDVLKGDLPGVTNAAHPTPVQVLQDFPFGSRSDEGRAMLQIVHDVAPGAELAFRTGFLGAVDMANGIRALEQADCDVIVDDISYIAEPFFRDGVIAQAVDEVKALGVTYFSAAGNFGTKSWQGTYAPVAPPAGVVGTAHNFAANYGGSDIFQGVTLYEGEYTIVFQWDDGTPGTTTNSDFDIYLANTNGSTLFGFNRMNIGGDPLEVLPFVVTADSVQSNIVIVRETGSGPATLKYIVYRGFLQIDEYDGLNASTLTGQANAAGAIAVGAVLYSNTPEFGVTPPTVASFSSRGGTPVNGVLRSKPEIAAPNGVNTSVDLGGVNIDGDAFPNFFGTSAAAPHAAGVAALVLEARTKYYGDTLSPDLVKGILQNTAIDMGAPGYDVATGAGFILADSALLDLANPSPYITGIFYDTTLTPGVDTLLLTVYGEYLNDSSTIWLDGAPLTSGVIIQGDSAIITIVDPFSGLYPEIQVYNPPQAGTNGTDGGLSNPLYFTTKETILVTVDNKNKVYGQALPVFTADYALASIDGNVPLDSAGLTQAEVDRIHDIELTTIATALSNVGLWGISADPADPLSPNSTVPATDPLDIAILQNYNIVFVNGLLNIDPLDLFITPRDTTFMYNDSIVGIGYDYLFNNGQAGIVIGAADSLTILNTIRTTRGTALVNAAGVVRGTALVNNNGDPLLTDSLLSNFSMMISQRVTTTRGTALVNGELIEAEELYYASAFANSTARSVRGTALVNGYQLVRGTALVNTLDSMGNVTNTTPLTNSGSLVNSSGGMNTSTITLDSNTETIVILGDGDIAILSGDSVGDVDIRSLTVVTDNVVGTHLIIPGTFLTNNFRVTYGLGNITILPDTATFTIDPASLTQTYDGGPKSFDVTVVPDSVDFTITYNGSATQPVNAGTYAVHVVVTDPNYVGSADAILVIQPDTATFTIDPASLTQTYTGGPRTAAITVAPAGVAYTVTYNGLAALPVNAGPYAVLVTVNDPNYVGTASATLVVQPAVAQVTITASTLTQTYTGGPRTVAVTTVPAGLANSVTYDGITTLPVNAGSYAVAVTVSDPNYVGTASATLVVQKATAQITITASTLTQTYNAGPRTVTVSTVPAGLANIVTYNGSATLPVNAASYAVLVTVNDPNYEGTASGTLVVQKAPATATTGIYVINKNAALPSFTATYSGFLNGQTSSVVTSITFTVSPTYTGDAGVYTITPVPVATNYIFTPVTGTLYVNPAGPGTNQVRPNFICYQVLSPAVNGYTHVAYFNYVNNNATPVYIPVGANNSFSGSARDASEQPVLFLPGTSDPIAIPYMGGALTWQIRSNKNNGGTGAIQANNSNVVCTAPGQRVLAQESAPELRVYPNPSAGQVFVELPGGETAVAEIEVFNALGVRCPVRVQTTSGNVIGLDLSSFGTGLFIIHVIQDGRVESRRVIIE